MTTALDPNMLAAIMTAMQAQQTAPPAAYAPATAMAPGTVATAPGYPAMAAPAPAVPLPKIASMDEFFNQRPSGGGKSWRFRNETTTQPMIGQSYWGIVERMVTEADMEAVTNPTNGQVQTRKDGSVKWQMKVPMLMVPQAGGYEDGHGQLYVKSDLQAKLDAAMSEVGLTKRPPEPGAFVQVTLMGIRPIKNMSPQYLYAVVYRRPDDPWTVERTAEVNAAHAVLGDGTGAPAGPPAPPVAGAPPAEWMAYAQAMAAQAPAAAAVPAMTVPPAATAPPPAATAPPPAAPTAPATPAPTAPAAPATPVVTTPAPAPAGDAAAQLAAAAEKMGLDVSQLAGLPPEAQLQFLQLTGKIPAPVG